MRIGVIGNGVVGGATGRAFAAKGHEVRYYDRDYAKCQGESSAPALLRWAELSFICLPTPQAPKSLGCDVSEIDGFFRLNIVLPKLNGANLVLRSTVPIGYTRKAREKYGLPNLVHSPEFLTARTADEDAANPTRLIIGGSISDGQTALCKLYDATWPDADKWLLTSDESEAVKLMQNSFSAVKVAMFNEMRRLADKVGLDWNLCLEALLAGGWINAMHTQVPGPDGKRGFGGSCLPKDLANWIDCCDRAGVERLVSAAAHMANEHIDRKETK